jgi:hypothetical protein
MNSSELRGGGLVHFVADKCGQVSDAFEMPKDPLQPLGALGVAGRDAVLTHPSIGKY